jgi:hypothetical protein
MKVFITVFSFFFSLTALAQSTVLGIVTDTRNNPIPGANVYIDGTYDGTSSGEQGNFSFTTSEKGKQILVVSYLAYETARIEINVESAQNLIVKLKESVNTLDAVVITAGTFEAGDKARVSVLKPLDIVTTAGSAGDIVAALQTLPGTQTVGEDGRLYVRGGEADEAQTFVDGIRVAQPYGATTNELPTRGRFSPFLFSGISFSTGGYSAEYGEALSSVLLLNTQDEPDQSKTDIALMTVGLGLGNTQKWKKSSLSVNATYIDLAPYQVAVPQEVDWNRPFQSLAGETVYRYQFEKGLLKLYAAFDASRFDLNQETVNPPYENRIDLHNNNFYLNTSYRGDLRGEWQLFTGLGYGYSQNKIAINADDVENNENALHVKLKLKKNFSDRFKLSFGGDYFVTRFDETFAENAGETFNIGYEANIAAAYVESDVFFSKNFATKIGVRASHNSLLEESTVSPRVSLAYKIKRKGQFSFAYGDFTQAPKAEYLKFSNFHQFENEKARHYILNYQYTKEKQTFRIETYLKEYRDLVKYAGENENTVYSNAGNGYAKGIDVFWRDGKNIKNLEYWISYSFIDTKRDYRNFPTSVTPNFVASHSLSVVTKYWFNSLRSQLGVSNSFSSGRPFNDPNQTAFMASKTKSYNSMSVSWAYLVSAQKILYFSVSNVLGNQNVFGYEYADAPDGNGIYNRRAVRPTADRFFFVGFFWTISDDKKSNQLDNL